MLTRINKIRKTYTLTPIELNKTEISHLGKSITVNMSLADVSQAWYNWTVKGFFIQDVFTKLSRDEREFLMTGMTTEEWNKTFAISDPRD